MSAESGDATINEYAGATQVTNGWIRSQLRSGRPLASSYAALRVLLKGRPWGVLVIDSRRSEPINKELLSARFTTYGSVLTPLLEKV